MVDYSRWALIAATALAVAGCSSSNNSAVKVLSGGGQATSSSNAVQAEPIRMLSAEEIRSTLLSKSWQYTRTESSGFITYNADGSLSFQDDVKGEGRGTWSAVQGELCQSLGGQPTECNAFKSTGDAYHVGKMRLVGV